jgi:2-oxoglutarate ferredoxin oxidoreductase subunit beta
MGTIEDFGNYETAWCPGCGNHSILDALKSSLSSIGLEPHEVLIVSGIGQAAKLPHYLKVNVFNGLHGRSLPVATGVKLANSKLNVIAESGDGCNYGEGGNHFLSAIRRNVNITLLVHNNQIYGLTKGQASPTTQEGFITKAQPGGVFSSAFNPVQIAVTMKAGFVARAFSGRTEHLSVMISEGIEHNGFALIDILQPCVSFNKINSFAWYEKRCYELPGDYDPMNWKNALEKAAEWGDKIPIGIIYRNERKSYERHFQVLSKGPLMEKKTDMKTLRKIMEGYG